MQFHRPKGPPRVSGSNRLEDPAVGLVRALLRAGNPEREGALACQPFDQRIVNRGEDRIAGDGGKGIVERDIGALEAADVTARRRVGIERAAQPARRLAARPYAFTVSIDTDLL